MEKTESETSLPENLAAKILVESSADITPPELLVPALNTQIAAPFSDKMGRLKWMISELLLAIILGITAYFLWLHWVVIQYNYTLEPRILIAHLFRIQSFAAGCAILLIALSFLCLIDAIRRILSRVIHFRHNSIETIKVPNT